MKRLAQAVASFVVGFVTVAFIAIGMVIGFAIGDGE